jgi:hypothetical protein
MAILIIIICMTFIQIIIVLINDIKVWAKIDRVVSFFKAEKNNLILIINEIKNDISDLKEQQASIIKEISIFLIKKDEK